MSFQFKVAGKAEVMAAFEAIHGKLKPVETLLDATQSKLADIRIAMRGGPDSLRLLQPKTGESAIARRARALAFENANILRLVVDTHADLSYGHPPMRSATFKDDPKSEQSAALSQHFGEVYKTERVASAFRQRLAMWSLRDNSAVVKTWYDATENRIRLSCYPKEFVQLIHDPMDADSNLGAVELVRIKGGKFARYLWTTNEVGWIDDAWQWTPGPNSEPSGVDNPTPGITQYIPFGFDHPSDDIGSAMWDVYLSQLQQVQLRSQVASGVRAQLLAVPVVRGKLRVAKQTDGATGVEYVYIGHDKPLMLEHDAEFQFVSPGFDVEKVSSYELSRLKHYLEMYGVSALAVDSAAAPDKPMALAIKMYRSMRERSKHILAFADAERALADSVIGLAAYHGLWPEAGLDVDNLDEVNVEVKFPDNVLPSDRLVERQQAATEVEKTLRTRARFIKEFVMPDASDEEIQAEEDAIDEDAAVREDRTAAVVTSAMGRRGPATIGPTTGGNGQSAADALLANVEAGRQALNGGAR